MNMDDKAKEEQIFGYKVGIAFSYILTTLFTLSIFSFIYHIYRAFIDKTFSIFDVIILVFGSIFTYFIFFKTGTFLRKSCKEQLKNLDNSHYVYYTVIDIKNTIISVSGNTHDTNPAVKYYCENNIEVIRKGANKNDINIGDKIRVLVWSDKYRTYYDYADKD